MNKLRNITKKIAIPLVGVVAGVAAAFYPISLPFSLNNYTYIAEARADGYSEETCLKNYAQLKNASECQKFYKENFVGSQGVVINTPGGCENKRDDDNDNYVDGADVDCHDSAGKVLPGAVENNPKSGPYIKTQETPIATSEAVIPPPPPPPPEKGSELKGFEGGIGFNVGPVNSEITYPDGNSSSLEGNMMQYGGYIGLPLGKNAKAILRLTSSNLEQDISNDTYSSLGSFKSDEFGVGLTLPFELVDGKLILAPGIAYNKQDNEVTIEPLDLSLKESIKSTDVSLIGLYNFYKNYSALLGVTQRFVQISQEEVSKKANLGTYEAGVFGKWNKLEAGLGMRYNEIFNIEADKNLSGLSLTPKLKCDIYNGNKPGNIYAFVAGQLPASDNGLVESSIGGGVGLKGIGKLKWPEIRVSYTNNKFKSDNGITESSSTGNMVGIELMVNNGDWFRLPFYRPIQ